MKFRLLLLIVLFLSKNGLAQNKPQLFSQSVKEDLDYLYKSLQSTHYNLFAFQSKKSYDSLYNQLKLGLPIDSLTVLQTVTHYQKLVSFANTGHCEIDFPAQSYIDYAYNGGTIFPLELAFENNKAFVRKNFSTDLQIQIGDELLAIDGMPINEVLQQLYPFVSAERLYFKNAKIEFTSFPRLLVQLNGKKDSWIIQTKNKDNQISKLEVKAVSVIDYEKNI